MIFLIWGGNGWIGSMIRDLLCQHHTVLATSRLEDYVGIGQELDKIKPDYVIHAAGIVGRPTVDWCENNQQDTYLVNTIGSVNLVDACWRRNIHVTYYATGCIYTYDDKHPIGTAFTEMDSPNFTTSTYSHSKVMAETLLKPYSNVLILRIRMPIAADSYPGNIIWKLSRYPKVINIPNSFSVLPELLPISISMTIDNLTGIYNLTNPGAITHSQILTLYQKYIDPDHTWETFSVEEQDQILQTKRSNCTLDTSKLEAYHPVKPIVESLENIFQTISVDE